MNKRKPTDDNQQFFLSHDTEHKDSYKQNKNMHHEKCLLVADRVSICIIPNSHPI